MHRPSKEMPLLFILLWNYINDMSIAIKFKTDYEDLWHFLHQVISQRQLIDVSHRPAGLWTSCRRSHRVCLLPWQHWLQLPISHCWRLHYRQGVQLTRHGQQTRSCIEGLNSSGKRKRYKSPTVLHSLRINTTVTKTDLNLYLIELALVTGYLGVLGDLNHSNPFVRRTLLTWVREMVQNYSALAALAAGLMVVNGG